MCDFFAKILIIERHADTYFTVVSYMPIVPLIKKEIIADIDLGISTKNIINNNKIITISDYMIILERNISSLKQYQLYKNKNYGKNSAPFNQSIHYITFKISALNVEYVSSESDLESMDENNFYFIICNMINLKKYNYNVGSTIIWWDYLYQMYIINNVIYHMYALTCMTFFGKGVSVYIAYIAISSHEDSIIIKKNIKDISEHYYRNFNQIFNSTFMIDDLPAQKKSGRRTKYFLFVM